MNNHRDKNSKHISLPIPSVSPRFIEVLLPIMVCTSIVVVAVFIKLNSPASQHITNRTVAQAVRHPATIHRQVQRHPTSVAVPSISTPAPTVTKTVSPTVITTSSNPQPTVTPSPNSSVSNLTPASTTSPSSSTPTTTPPTTTGYSSTNWSGYLAATGTFSGISASWTVPQATGSSTTKTSADATWIGIGGVTSSDLIQVGTQDIVSPGGQVSTAAFYELLPNVSQTIPGVTVASGDSMTASLTETSPGLWTINIIDNNNGQSFTQTVAYASSQSSAEWIEEDPSHAFNRLFPLDNFGTASFTSGLTTDNGSAVTIAGSNAQPVTLVTDEGQAVATPSVIGSDGGSFNITQDSPTQ